MSLEVGVTTIKTFRLFAVIKIRRQNITCSSKVAMTSRIVALVDMDCFYVQVEQRLDPQLQGKPVAVVQYNKWRGGGIIAVNYEARSFGVTRSMRGAEAKEKCPDIGLVHVPEKRGKADISKYRDAGREVVDVLCQFSKCVERASVDEAYLDLTEAVEQRLLQLKPSVDQLPTTFIVGYESTDPDTDENDEEARRSGVSAWLQQAESDEEKRLAMAAHLVEEIRAAVYTQTGFRCSAGIAHNKVLGKLVCGLHKPNRQTVLPFSQVPHLYATLPVRKVKSLGGKLGETLMQTLNINVMADLEKFTEAELCQKFDYKNGSWLYNIARGIDNDPVMPRLIPKSIGCCKRFPGGQALATRQKVEHWLSELAKEVSERLDKDLEENHRRALSMTVQWHVGSGSSSSKTGALTSYDASSIAAEALHMLAKANTAPIGAPNWKPPLQFLGINVGKFTEEENKNSSIQKFFKRVDKINSSCDENPREDCQTEEPSVIETKVKSSNNLQSFFLSYKKPRKDETCDKDSENESADDMEIIEPARSSTPEEEATCPQCEAVIPLKEINSHLDQHLEDSTREESPELAPCPQCAAMVAPEEMSEHLDHHVAEELHKQLNSNPPAPRELPPSSSQNTKKRKYTKAATKNNSTKFAKGIDSFFKPK